MSVPEVDSSNWPLVVVRMPSDLTLEELDTHFADLRVFLAREKRFAAVIDTTARGNKPLPALHRKHLGEHLVRLRPAMSRLYLCEAYVIPSAVGRGVMTAIHWVVRPPWPTHYSASLDDAIAWVSERIRKEVPTFVYRQRGDDKRPPVRSSLFPK